MSKLPNYWFPAKRYGWGWSLPRTWQGWLVLVGYFAALLLMHLELPSRTDRVAFTIGVGTATLVLIIVCYLKGEPLGPRRGR